jgi:hypothetical protein
VLRASTTASAPYVGRLPAKLVLSLDYLDRRTLRSDLGILARTLVRIARGGRAASDVAIVARPGRRTGRAALG